MSDDAIREMADRLEKETVLLGTVVKAAESGDVALADSLLERYAGMM